MFSSISIVFPLASSASRCVKCSMVPLVLCAVSSRGGAITLDARAEHPLAGVWTGTASTGNDTSGVFLRFVQEADDAVTAYLDLPVTNLHDVPFGKFEHDGDGYAASGTRLRLDEGTQTLTGGFRFQDREIQLKLTKGGSIPPLPAAHVASKIVQPVWTFDAKYPIWSSPAVSAEVVYFGGSDGRVHALKAQSGEPVWEFRAGGAVIARPTLVGAHVYVPSDDGMLYKLDARSGTQVWRFDMGGGTVERKLPRNGEPGYDYLASTATVEGGVVFVGSADGRLCAVDAETGAARWSFKTNDIVRSTPAVADGVVVFGSRDNHVYAVDAKTGALKWKHDTGDCVVSSPVVDAGNVYIGSRSADLFAFEASTGKVKWRYFYWFSWVESSGTLRDDVLYVGSSDAQQLLALDAKNGRALWSFDTDGSAWSSPAVTESTVYIGAVGTVGYMVEHRGGFFAVNRADGRERWRVSMDEIKGAFTYGVASSPAVANGLVFFGGLDGKFYACAAR